MSFNAFVESSTEEYEKITVEVLSSGNVWQRISGGVLNTGQSIARALESAKRSYPNNRVRAIGAQTGRFYDMRP